MTTKSIEAVCPFDNASAEVLPNRELEPLTLESDRRDVQRRLIGPLTTLATVSAIDEFRGAGQCAMDNASNRLEDCLDSQSLGKQYDLYGRTFWGSLYGVRRDIDDIVMHDGWGVTYEAEKKQYSMTDNQSTVLKSNTYKNTMSAIVVEGLAAQTAVTFDIALPGFMICKYNLESSEQVAELVMDMGPAGVAEVLGRTDFASALSRMAITASGLYGFDSHGRTDKPNTPVFKMDAALEASPQEVLPPPVTVYDLYEKGADGNIALSKAATEILVFNLRFRNNVLPEDKELAGITGFSRGCPVVQDVAYVRQDDLTPGQWQGLLEGDNPIALYEPQSQKLTFKRHVFEEVNQLFIDILTGGNKPAS